MYLSTEAYPLGQLSEPCKPQSVQSCQDLSHQLGCHWVVSCKGSLTSPHQFADTLAETHAVEKELGCGSRFKKKKTEKKICQEMLKALHFHVCVSLCARLTEDVVLKLPLGRMSSVAAATSAMSLAGFSLESEEVALSAPRYWSTLSRESINTASGGVPIRLSISGK